MVPLFILKELEEKLVCEARLSPSEAGDILDAVNADADITETRPLAARVCRDADDDWILTTALAAKADALVTGDKDLLVLGKHQGVPILTPRDGLALLRSDVIA